MSVSLTELRQRLFQLADRVAESGEPLVVMRNGVRLLLVRDESMPASGGRLAQLETRQAWIGPPPDPHFSPAQWNDEPLSARVAQPPPPPYLPPLASGIESKPARKRR